MVSERQTGCSPYPGLNFRFKKNSVLDWATFSRYALRIRLLHHDESKRKYIDESAWNDILHTKPHGDLLPNLQSLLWHAVHADRQHWSLLFMHAKVRYLSLQIHRSPGTPTYIATLLERVSGLTELELRSDSPIRDVESDILPLLHCPTLRRVVVPLYFLTTAFMTQLSRCPDLHDIQLSRPVEQGTGDRTDVLSFRPTLEEHAFPVLERLAFSAHVLHAIHFLAAPFAPKQISFLYLNVIAVDAPLVVRDFFSTIAAECKSLIELHVDFVICPGAPMIYPPPPLVDRPTLDTFRPLLSCARLKRFEFRWDYQMNVTQADMEELASSWPALETLLLNCQPIPENTPPLLTLEALIPFAQHCPHLRELGLYLDAQDIPPALSYPSPRPLSSFRSLQKLSVGASCIAQVEPVALFLSQLCPLGCQIVSGVRWPDAYGIALDQLGILDHRRLQMTEWWVRWMEMAKVLPLVTKARLEEKIRIAALREKMETLALHRTEQGGASQIQHELDNIRALLRG
ncbi:hypothetical protein EUX98_g5182 [Antrodiella citrinella]|uniref:F-box domain-containing protein n=1 Tax=Antrodiella citrinella TaxID=2447956 RepID=A0A4S4MSE0_9APHY|nr:hypothetical protein EUX98_g5182 [Antrodiella citrinella]